MATLKAIVKSKARNGMYNVYIRITQNRQFAYVRTSWMVNDKGLSDDKKDIIDPFSDVLLYVQRLLIWFEFLLLHLSILQCSHHLDLAQDHQRRQAP